MRLENMELGKIYDGELKSFNRLFNTDEWLPIEIVKLSDGEIYRRMKGDRQFYMMPPAFFDYDNVRFNVDGNR